MPLGPTVSQVQWSVRPWPETQLALRPLHPRPCSAPGLLDMLADSDGGSGYHDRDQVIQVSPTPCRAPGTVVIHGLSEIQNNQLSLWRTTSKCAVTVDF